MVETIDVRPRRTARTRVTNVLKRLRRRNASNTEKPLDRLDDNESESQSDVSGITDLFIGDDSSWENRKDTREQREESKQSRQTIPLPKSMPSLLTIDTDSTDSSLSESLGTWLDSLSSLAKSKEMNLFLQSSNKLAASAAQASLDTAKSVGGIMVHTALLPVTLPMNITASATGIVFNKGSDALHYFCDTIVPIAVHQSNLPQNMLLLCDKKSSKKETHSKLKSQRMNESQRDEILDRLRLDLNALNISADKHKNRNIPKGDMGNSVEAVYSIDTDSLAMILKQSGAEVTKFSIRLLRVEDIKLQIQPDPSSDVKVQLLCIDLHEDYSDKKLTIDALTQLTQRAMDIALSNKAVVDMLPFAPRESIDVEWKPLGQTKKDYKRLLELSEDRLYDELSSRVLVWSGKYTGEKYYGSENPFFMSRGIVNGAPLDVLNLLWDSKRTREYNKHCVKREDKCFIIKEDVAATQSGFFGAKIIESETKVPMTKISVGLSALLCAKPLGSSSNDGYVVFSRSLSSGSAGYHSLKRNGVLQNGNNEVIFGINIIRSVPGRSGWSDLISISQVDASILPQFLKSRVGIMAVEDFFKHARTSLKSSNLH